MADLAPSEDLTQNVRGGASSALGALALICTANVPGFSTGNGTFSAGGGCGAVNPFYKTVWATADPVVATVAAQLTVRTGGGDSPTVGQQLYNGYWAPTESLFDPATT